MPVLICGDAAIGESQWDDDGDRFVRQEACVGIELRTIGCESEAGESEWRGICDGFVGGLVLDDLGGCHGGWFCSWNDGFVRCGSSSPLNRSIRGILTLIRFNEKKRPGA